VYRNGDSQVACRRNGLQHPAGGVLIEFGSGFSLKTETLLQQLPRLGHYVLIDVSQSALADARRRLAARFPHIEIRPIVAASPIQFLYPASWRGDSRPASSPAQRSNRGVAAVAGFPGRTGFGWTPHRRLRSEEGCREARSRDDDRAGVTAVFNLNLLARDQSRAWRQFRLEGVQAQAHFQYA